MDVDKQVYVQHYRTNGSGELQRYYRCKDNSFSPAVHGGRTIVLVKIGEEEYHGEALCSDKDQFCYRTGYRIALGRAMKSARTVSCSC